MRLTADGWTPSTRQPLCTILPTLTGRPPGGTDGAVFACRVTPALFMGGADWSYDPYTWHTNRDTYDKVVFDDLRHNAVLAAMLAYEAADDSAFVSRTKSPGRWPPTWPANCGKARRSTTPP